MPKTHPIKRKSRPAKSRPAARAQPSKPSASIVDNHEAVLRGLTDPFSAEAAIAQYPDAGAGRSLTFQARFSTTVVNTAGGAAALAFSPKVNYPLLPSASISGTTATWAAAWDVDLAGLVNTYGESYRPTSMGVRIANTLSATNSSGYLVIAKGGPPTLSSTTSYAPQNFTSYDLHPFEHGGEWHVSLLPRQSAAYTMRPLSLYNSTTTGSDPTWETLYVGLFGSTASTAALIIEGVINYEFITAEDAAIAQMAAPQPVLNIGMQTAINQIQSGHPNSFKGARDKVQQHLKREGKKALLKHVLPFVAKKATQLLL